MSFLQLDHLEKRYSDGFLAVKGISLSVEPGEFIVLLGPSGCGKTTTLRMVAGLEIATAGSIRMAGADVTHHRPSQRDVGMVFQFYALYPHLTVRDNILFPLVSIGMPVREREAALSTVVERLGIGPLLPRSPRQLSGGDQQRVSLARAMIRRPQMWLMDEPLGTLDSDQRESLRDFIREQQHAFGITTLYVTHDQDEAMSLADRIVVMEAGVIRQVGTPRDVYQSPSDLFVADFVGSPGMNRLTGTIANDAFHPTDGAAIPLPQPYRTGSAVLGVRSEHVLIDPTGPLEGTVVLDEYCGGWRNLHCDAPCGRIVMRTAPGTRRRPGETLRMRFDPLHTLLFDSSTGQRL